MQNVISENLKLFTIKMKKKLTIFKPKIPICPTPKSEAPFLANQNASARRIQKMEFSQESITP